MKNIVFIPNIDLGNGRNSSYKYSIKSWKAWCDKNDCELYIMSDLLLPESEMLITWQRWQVLNILEHNEVDYDQVLVVDADSIVHPDCPNFFELTEHKYAGVVQEGSMDWCGRSIEHFSRFVFDGFMMPYENYINSGFQI